MCYMVSFLLSKSGNTNFLKLSADFTKSHCVNKVKKTLWLFIPYHSLFLKFRQVDE